jgi:hypothetical protein
VCADRDGHHTNSILIWNPIVKKVILRRPIFRRTNITYLDRYYKRYYNGIMAIKNNWGAWWYLQVRSELGSLGSMGSWAPGLSTEILQDHLLRPSSVKGPDGKMDDVRCWCQEMARCWFSGWWFGTFFIFPYSGNHNSNWLIFFRGIETTNQFFTFQDFFMFHRLFSR